MNKEELRQKICAAEKQAAADKKKRKAKATAGFAIAYFLCFWFMEGEIADLKSLIQMVVISVILSFIHFAINESVFSHLHAEADKDRQMLEIMKKQLEDT